MAFLRFWYEEGANNFYSSIDPSEQKEVGNQNAWVGGYNPSSGGGGMGAVPLMPGCPNRTEFGREE